GGSGAAVGSQRLLHVAVQRSAHGASAAGSSLLLCLWSGPRGFPAVGGLSGLFSARHPGGPLPGDRNGAARCGSDLPLVQRIAAGALWIVRRLAGAHSDVAGVLGAAERIARGDRKSTRL